MSTIGAVLQLCIFAFLTAQVTGGRTRIDLLTPDKDFTDGVEAAVSIQDPEYNRDRTRDAFQLLYKGYYGVSTEVLDQLGPSSENVLHFLLDFFKFDRIRRNQVEAVVKRLTGEKGSAHWARAAASRPVRRHVLEVLHAMGVNGMSLGPLEKRGSQNVADFLGCFGIAIGELGRLEEEEAQPALEEDDATEQPLDPGPLQREPSETDVQPDPLQAKVERAFASVRTMKEPREYQNRGEDAFSDLRRAVLILRGSAKRTGLLSLFAADAHMTWEFLVRWVSERRIFRYQVAEVASVLIASQEFKDALLNDPKLVDAVLACPGVEAFREQLLPALQLPQPQHCRSVKDGGGVQPGDGVRTFRLLLTRARLCQPGPGSWAGCGIQGVQWVGAEPYKDSLAAARTGFGQVVHAAPYLATLAGGIWTFTLDHEPAPEPAERVEVSGASWDLADAADRRHPAATGERDWPRFEQFLAEVVVPSLRGNGPGSSEAPAVAVVVNDGIIREAFGRGWAWWNGYRSTLCQPLLSGGGVLPEVLEIIYEVVEGGAVALAKRPDGSPNCRAVGDCSCFK